MKPHSNSWWIQYAARIPFFVSKGFDVLSKTACASFYRRVFWGTAHGGPERNNSS